MFDALTFCSEEKAAQVRRWLAEPSRNKHAKNIVEAAIDKNNNIVEYYYGLLEAEFMIKEILKDLVQEKQPIF